MPARWRGDAGSSPLDGASTAVHPTHWLISTQVSALAERDCGGACTGAPSNYRAGDHSLPHTDWADQRTVAF